MKYPRWFPYPSCWLSALLLLFLTSGVVVAIRFIVKATMLTAAATESIEIASLGILAAVLLPVFIIAIIHHWLHCFLTRFAPKIQAPEIGKVTGVMPTLFSWWESLWGWLAMTLASVVMGAIGLLTHRLFGVSLLVPLIPGEHPQFELLLTVTWLTTSAYIYHVQLLVEHRWRVTQNR